MLNNIKQLPRLLVFATVARQGSFTRAGELLGISKSAVSQQISQLESEMEVRLLNRTTRGVSLTALGEKLLQRCDLLQDQVELVFADIEEASSHPTGRFAITYPHALQTSVILPAIEQLCIEYPGLEPELIADDHPLDLVTNHIDVAIHAGELPDSTYRALPVGQMTEVFCATPLYLNRHSPIESVTDLSDHQWISTAWQSSPISVFKEGSLSSEQIQLMPFARTNTLPAAVEMAKRHLGVVLLPDVVAEPMIKNGELVRVAAEVTGPHWPLYTLHAYSQEKPVHITRFHQLVCRFFSQAR